MIEARHLMHGWKGGVLGEALFELKQIRENSLSIAVGMEWL
jgi:hypothetical protein